MSFLGETLMRIVREKAAANPDFVYQPPRDQETGLMQSCMYVRNGCPDCLIGHALFEAQLIDPSLEGDGHNHVPVYAVLDYLGVQLEVGEQNWLRDVQRAQDNQRPWRAAVRFADGERQIMSGIAA